MGELVVNRPHALVIGPFGSDLKVSDYRPAGVPVVFVKNVRPNAFDASGCQFLNTEKAAKLKAHTVRPGDLIITKMGFPPCVAAIYPRGEPEGIVTADIIKMSIDQGKALDKYVVHFLNSSAAKEKIERFTFGQTRPKVTLRDFRELTIPLPQIGEQRRVAAILDKADAIRCKNQEAIALTEQLLRSTFLEMFGDPVSNPKRWPTKSLGELATFTGGGTPSRSVPEYFDGATCWATSKDMKGEVLSDTEEHITDDAIQNSATKLVPPGTILVVVKSKILMHRLPVLVAAVPTCFGQDLKGLSLRDSGLTYYVARHMRIGQDTLLRRARGVNTEGLTLEHLAEYVVMQPPSEMIDRYVKFELATTKAARVSREARADADHLFNSLVQRAFSGQL